MKRALIKLANKLDEVGETAESLEQQLATAKEASRGWKLGAEQCEQKHNNLRQAVLRVVSVARDIPNASLDAVLEMLNELLQQD